MNKFGKLQAIKNNLNKMDIDFSDFENGIYCGGNGTETSLNLFFKFFNNKRELPEHINICLCNTSIKKNYYVLIKNIDAILILGGCCIKNFVRSDLKQTCPICKTNNKNRNTILCNECKICHCYKCFKTKDIKYTFCEDCYDEINGIEKIACPLCNVKHKNKNALLCNECKIGHCIDCHKVINKDFKKMF